MGVRKVGEPEYTKHVYETPTIYWRDGMWFMRIVSGGHVDEFRFEERTALETNAIFAKAFLKRLGTKTCEVLAFPERNH